MSSSSVGAPRWRRHLVPGAIMGVLTLAAVLFVLASLRRPSIDTWPPTPPDPREVGTMRVGPRTYTVDAMASGQWVFFDFSRGSIVSRPGPLDWDLAFQRFRIIANGGRGFAGRGAVADLGSVALELPVVVPADAWVDSERRPYAPPRYAVCYGDPGGYEDPSRLLRLLPPPAEAILRGKERTYRPEALAVVNALVECFEVSTEEARALDQILEEADFQAGVKAFFGFSRGPVSFEPILPHGTWHFWGG